MSTIEKPSRVTLAAYLELEAANSGQSEIYDGEIVSIARGSYAHGVSVSNIRAALDGKLKDSNCGLSSSRMKIHLETSNAVVYPDVMVVCPPF